MALLSANLLAPKITLIPFNSPSYHLPRIPTLPPTSLQKSLPNLLSHNRTAVAASSSSFAAATTDIHPQEKNITSQQSRSNWEAFARRVSGEWDGFGAEFTADGKPVELPEAVVPEAFREWGVQLFDWQTQCPTLAAEAGDPVLSYKLIKLLPTVGCEADAATRHSVEERIAGGTGNKVSAFGYDSNGCYVAVWLLEGRNGRRFLELEHCLVDPENREARVRVIQVVRVDEGEMGLERIRVFSEQWYGPFQNGEQFGGCAIRESGFASMAAVEEFEVVGVWQGTSVAVARFQTQQTDIFHELVVDRPEKSIRNQLGLVLLPKQLWCYFKQNKDGETWGEVGWLLNNGNAVTSRCIFLKDGRLQEIAIGQEIAVLNGM
ncbi:Chromosomal replication initiator protein DnaA [Cocos nucifera]|nr:Chromosomal replication initiator protein DnaA [Cocos nucifera]